MSNRKENIVTLKDAIKQMLSVYKISGKMDELSIQKEWEELLGPMIAKRTRKIQLKDRILHVQIESSVLRHELLFAKRKIVQDLNARMGQKLIDELKLY